MLKQVSPERSVAARNVCEPGGYLESCAMLCASLAVTWGAVRCGGNGKASPRVMCASLSVTWKAVRCGGNGEPSPRVMCANVSVTWELCDVAVTALSAEPRIESTLSNDLRSMIDDCQINRTLTDRTKRA